MPSAWVGEGHWQVAQFVNNGVFTPGLMGTPLSLTGNFVQSSTGTLRVLVTPGGISSFAVTGTATLGGSLSYVLAPGTYAPGRAVFLTASGGITGNFASITTTTPTGPAASPLLLSADTFASANIGAMGSVLTISGPAVVAPSGALLFADTIQAMAMGGFASSQALLEHATGNAPACEAPPASGTGQTANMAAALASAICAAGGWMQVTGEMASAIGAYSLQGGGFLAGLDHANGLGGRIGLAAGYDTGNMRDKSGGTAGLQTIRLGVYAAQPLGRFLLSGDLLGGIISRNTRRTTGADAATAKRQRQCTLRRCATGLAAQLGRR
jgi:hypothetical protein